MSDFQIQNPDQPLKEAFKDTLPVNTVPTMGRKRRSLQERLHYRWGSRTIRHKRAVGQPWKLEKIPGRRSNPPGSPPMEIREPRFVLATDEEIAAGDADVDTTADTVVIPMSDESGNEADSDDNTETVPIALSSAGERSGAAYSIYDNLPNGNVSGGDSASSVDVPLASDNSLIGAHLDRARSSSEDGSNSDDDGDMPQDVNDADTAKRRRPSDDSSDDGSVRNVRRRNDYDTAQVDTEQVP